MPNPFNFSSRSYSPFPSSSSSYSASHQNAQSPMHQPIKIIITPSTPGGPGTSPIFSNRPNQRSQRIASPRSSPVAGYAYSDDEDDDAARPRYQQFPPRPRTRISTRLSFSNANEPRRITHPAWENVEKEGQSTRSEEDQYVTIVGSGHEEKQAAYNDPYVRPSPTRAISFESHFSDISRRSLESASGSDGSGMSDGEYEMQSTRSERGGYTLYHNTTGYVNSPSSSSASSGSTFSPSYLSPQACYNSPSLNLSESDILSQISLRRRLNLLAFFIALILTAMGFISVIYPEFGLASGGDWGIKFGDVNVGVGLGLDGLARSQEWKNEKGTVLGSGIVGPFAGEMKGRKSGVLSVGSAVEEFQGLEMIDLSGVLPPLADGSSKHDPRSAEKNELKRSIPLPLHHSYAVEFEPELVESRRHDAAFSWRNFRRSVSNPFGRRSLHGEEEEREHQQALNVKFLSTKEVQALLLKESRERMSRRQESLRDRA